MYLHLNDALLGEMDKYWTSEEEAQKFNAPRPSHQEEDEEDGL